MGRRKRRIQRLLTLIGVIAAVATGAGYVAYRAAQPETHQPGEELPEITRRLSLDLPADAPEPRFVDVTAAEGLGEFVTFAGERTSQLPEDMGSGAAWGDFDNDGDDDLFVVAAGGGMDLAPEEWAPSRLYENDGGVFRPVDDFPELRLLGMGAAWGDVDDDGWLDLAVTGYGRLLLLRNERGRLVASDALDGYDGWWSGASWGDFDNDGDLDLYVCGYVRYETTSRGGVTQQYGAEVPYTLNPASFEAEPNLLLENDGSGRFEDVAPLYGVSNPGGRSLGALWQDFDEDGRLDLYVANDISDNALYLNRGDTFEDAGLAAWVADYRGAMGLTAGDWNRDGDTDLFITHWIAQENALYDSRLADMAAAGGNRAPMLTFSDLASPLGLGQIALQSVGWGTEFADFDGDGWLDLVVSNGSTLETGDQPPRLKPQPAMLFWNRQGEAFHDLAPLEQELAAPRVGRGLALADYDRDGDLDILKLHLGGGVQLLRNDMQSGNWLTLRLRRPAAGEGGAPRFAFAARATVHAGGVALRRAIGSSSYLSQSSEVLHFGLGETGAVERIEVVWPDGAVEEYSGVSVNAAWELVQGDPVPRRLDGLASANPSEQAPTFGDLSTGSPDAGGPGFGSAAGAQFGEPRDSQGSVASADERQRVVAFWAKQRAAMDAMKIDGDLERAIGLFREALALRPDHEDSRYYLANCLVSLGHTEEGLAELDELRRLAPSSHRAHRQWGVLMAVGAASEGELEAAREALARAVEINPEETGGLLALGEVELMLGRPMQAEARLAEACQTNPKAVGGFYLRGYVAWKRGDAERARELLARAQAARGEEWKPAGAVAEGDVAQRMHSEFSPLSSHWETWDGSGDDLAAVFAGLDAALTRPGLVSGGLS